MPVSRLPFAIEDLEREIRQVCGSEPIIDIVLDPSTHERVTSELASHFGNQLTQSETRGITRLGGVNIIRGANVSAA